MIDKNLAAAAAHSWPHNKRTAVIAYADDVTIILRSPKDIPIVHEALHSYEDESGAKLISKNTKRYTSLMGYLTQNNGILYHTELGILGIKLPQSTSQQSIVGGG